MKETIAAVREEMLGGAWKPWRSTRWQPVVLT